MAALGLLNSGASTPTSVGVQKGRGCAANIGTTLPSSVKEQEAMQPALIFFSY